MEDSVRALRAWPDDSVQIFHHNDADGLTSAAILTRAFERERLSVRRYCLEKPYPTVLRKIFEQAGRILVFADFAGRIAPLLSELNAGRNLTLILDHHAAEPSTDARVHNLDPDLFGLKGDRDISASTTCYLFARCLNTVNKDMAHVAALGAVADGFFVEGRLVSVNREVAEEAVSQGNMQISPSGSVEEYAITDHGKVVSCTQLGNYLDALGGVGYYQGGPEMGVRVCLEGVTTESDLMVSKLEAIRASAFDEETKRLDAGGLRQSPHVQWFHLQRRFFPMGVKMVGAFCDAIRDTPRISPDKYIAGFQIIPDEIPGFGTIQFNDVKVSMRVPPRMEAGIRAERNMGLNVLLPEATTILGGFSDACHSLTAATTISIGKEEKLIEEMERILERGSHG